MLSHYLLMVVIMIAPLTLMAQQSLTVSGKTNSDDGESLPGVNVLEKGTQNGAVSAADGTYTLRTSGDATLVFSFIGFASQEIAVGNRSTIDVTLVTDFQQLSEVVVIGYGTQKKSDLTGSVGSVNAERLEGRTMTSVEEGLQGQAAGVQVVQGSGQPGGRSFIRIRGQNSIIGGNDPLYVIDGVPVQSGNDGNTSLLATINQNDIESIDILKDASATAIYGARGSNGVVLITTKRGRTNQAAINFESTLGVSQVIRKLDVLDSRQFVTIANERAVNDGQALPFPDVEAASAINTNWQDEVFQNGIAQNYTLSAAGGDEKTKYFVSGNYTDQEGAVIESGFKRGSFRLNLDQKASDRLSFTSQLFVSRSVANRTSDGIIQSALGMPPINSPYLPDGSYTPGNTLLGYPFSDSSGDNPLITATQQLNQLTIARFLGNVRTKYKLTNDLQLELMLGADNTNNKHDSYQTRLMRNVPDGEGSQRRTENSYYVIEGLAQYNKNLSDGAHKINATLGFTREMQTTTVISAESAGFVTDDFQNRNLGAGTRFVAPQTGMEEWDILSFLGRANYTLNDKYLFTVSGRRDGSSRFGEGNKWGFFPSAAFAWRVANEEFMQELSVISDLKFRASIGKTGNQAISTYQSLQQFTPQVLVLGNANAVGFGPANLGNPDLKWETTQQMDVGLDVGLFDQRLQLSLDLYSKTTSDLLAVVNVPPTSGFATTLQNIGTVQNKGLELTTTYHIIRNKKDFNWTANFNISANRNKVTELSRGADIIVQNISFVGSAHILRVGQPVSSFYGVQEDGLTANGLIQYVDQTGDGLVNADDRVIMGNPYPDFIYGLNSQMSYKKFDFSVFIQGEAGRQLFNANKYYLESSFFRGNNNVSTVEDRWRPDDPNTGAAFPKASANTNFQWSDRFVEDASYLRVKSILIGYTHRFEAAKIKSLRVFASGQNLLTFTKYSWFNPDVNANSSGDLRIGVDLNTFPISKTFTAGVNIGI
jgi:TonB-linked SusC/RagA family outer membrane protein